MENLALITQITYTTSNRNDIVALLETDKVYKFSFDVDRECRFHLFVRDENTNEIIQSINLHQQHLPGHYEFDKHIPRGGILMYEFSGRLATISNIEIIER